MPEQTDIYISSFPDAESITNADKVTGLQGNANKNFTFSSILAWFVNAVKSAFVPVSRTINGKSLSSDVTLTATDVGARPDTWTPSADDVGAIPATAAGEPLGIAELDSNGQVPSRQLPAIPSQPSDIGAQAEITASGILMGNGAGGVSAATPGRDYQAPLTIDATPTASSTNPVQSGGIAKFGLGVQLNQITAVLDLNDVAETGWFCTSLAATANCPAAASNRNAVVRTIVRGASYAVQDFYDYASGTIFRRWKNSTWSSWYPVSTNYPATEQQLAYVETGTTASRAYAVGEYFCWNGLLYRVTSAISSGQQFNPGSNCKSTTVSGMLTLLTNSFTTNANGRVSSGLYWSQGYIVGAWSQLKEIRIYSNATNAQGFLVLDTSGNPVGNTTVSITYLVYNYNI